MNWLKAVFGQKSDKELEIQKKFDLAIDSAL
jgi:hypothetical protein